MAKSRTRSRGKAAAKTAPGKRKMPPADGNSEILRRIADALERLAPPAPPPLDFDSADAFVWYAEDHRLASVRHADRIYVLARGKVTETGSHAELMERAGQYAELYTLQASQYE